MHPLGTVCVIYTNPYFDLKVSEQKQIQKSRQYRRSTRHSAKLSNDGWLTGTMVTDADDVDLV